MRSVTFLVAASAIFGVSSALAQWQGLCPNGQWVPDGPGYRCVNTQQRTVTPQGQQEIQQMLQPPPPPTAHENAVMGALQWLGNQLEGGRKGLYGSQPLSAAVQNQPTVTPQEQQAVNQMLQPAPQPPPQSLPPGSNPFGGPQLNPQLSNQQSTLQPPPSYVDPFAGKPLPPPGQLGNCTGLTTFSGASGCTVGN